MSADQPEPEPAAGPDAEPDDIKDKFRDALKRKHSHDADQAAEAEVRDGSKIHGAHGPAATKRTFRRKSG